ncbi:YsnF/AvaK domain-containing protein [Neobacillus cucumis]|uniref:YsnF/AvaK domain-containing protein n=1 Tax=Neobacillus cucumis TaxID=1740721 RepID=UPI00285368F6|nr:YsnF/AvaK domain-containing protein [Neobacillus cucumis]MDR4947493.1 YsnF/AvaK domain-containing protein [Neobacillus cucumis]
MSMEKRVVGTFNSEQEVLYAIEELKRQGHRETDMMVVAKYRNDIPLITSQTGVMVEADTQVSNLAGVMMESFFSLMTVGMGGSPANVLSRRLIERGIPQFIAKQCEKEINTGKMILLVDTNKTYDNPIYEEQYETEKTTSVRLREEQLDIIKERVQVGELQLQKEVVEEQRTVYVPLLREEVYIERRPVTDGKYDGSAFTEDEIVRIPITEERIEVTKRPVVVEEVIVGKRKIQETKQVQDIIRKEEARIVESSVPSVTEAVTVMKAHLGQEEVIKESPDILIVEGNPDIESIMKEDKKEETHEKRTGSLVIKGEKNKPESSATNKDEANGMLTDSPVIKEHESYESITVENVKDEESHSNENSSKEENKNNKNQTKKRKNDHSQ